MATQNSNLILTINSGSSSVKFSLYAMSPGEDLHLTGKLDRIGVEGGEFKARDGRGQSLVDRNLELPDHDAAFAALFDWLGDRGHGQNLSAVGHRLVHGGRDHLRPQQITPEVMQDLRDLVPLALDHLPHEIRAIEAVRRLFPDLTQVACFDTAFHRHMPEVAQLYALPRELRQAGVIRYGFHGLSYEYLLQELSREDPEAAGGKMIIAHLGNGASMAAIDRGRSRDTTMGLTPTGGLVMSNRSGDLDPGVVLYLLREKGLSPDEVNNLLNHRAGLLGVSGISSDMQDLLAREADEPQAAAAVALFCYTARKFLGALAAALGGLETLVFTGGIGENSEVIRRRLCGGLAFLGLRLDEAANRANAPVISPPDASVTVRVMKTNEELMIARHTHELLAGS